MPVLDYAELVGGEDTLVWGVTFDDVKQLLPHRRWNVDVKPDQATVEAEIASVAAVLGIVIRPLPAGDAQAVERANRLVALAHRAVRFGAAAQVEAAGAPERANPNDASSYAEWLWERYQEALEEARAFADAIAPGDDPAGVGAVADEPAWSFPVPEQWAARGI